ncbi:hypothetical protein CF328_g8824, partial [Tilletia controversa]
MEAWIPNLGADTSSDRDHDAASIADTDRDTITHLHPTRSSAAVTSSIDPTRDLPPHLTGNTPLRPTAAHHVDSGGPEAARAGAERAVSEHAASPTRPHRPDKAAGRSGTPHELKPPQVQAFRTLTSKEKAAIQRLSALLGRPVRDCLDGDTSLVDLLSDPVPGSNEQLQPQSPSTPTSPTQPLPPTTPPDSPTYSRTLICRQEFIGTFEGQSMEVENFVSQIRDVWRSNRQPEWERAVVRALPMALKGDAAAWHQRLDDTEADALTSVDKWIVALREAFPVNAMRLRSRDEAHNRAWRPYHESASAYFHHKLRLLRQAWGYGQSDERLVSDIRSGFPSTFRVMLRIPQRGATLKALRLQITEYEPEWEEMYPAPSSRTPTAASAHSAARNGPPKSTAPPSGTAAATARSASAPASPAAAQSSPSNSTGAFGLAATYDPSRITPAANGKKRIYRRPDNDEPMELNRPCGRCGQDHFNFEHYHINAPQVR